MALWTPYADDSALDLSKSRKEDYLSPEYPVYPAYHFGYNIPNAASYISPIPALTVPVPHISPLSVTSVSSYERPFTPQYLMPERTITPSLTRIQTLSPPISPQSQKRPYSSIDDSLSDDPDFQAFERDALRAMAEKNGGELLANNPRMRRTVCSSNENNDSYRRQRERNNFAAKQSRDRRKLREIHLALKVTYLRKEVASLKALLASRVCSRCHESCTYVLS